MPISTATLDAGGTRPQVEIIVGHAHFAAFDMTLFDASGRNGVKFANGRTDDTIPDIFPIDQPPVKALDGSTIFWRAVVASPTGTPGEQSSVIVRVLQDGKIAGTDTKTGPITGPSPSGFIRLTVR